MIDELPKDRLPVKNCVVDTGYRETAYRFMKNQVAEGRQCYVICPMVEESEAMEAENVMDYSTMLSEKLGTGITVGYLHGKMKQQQKDEIMQRFADNQIQILVSTTVVEVGINVPNATVMMVENAERFGLAQLHQLRGRVGRGAFQSYCIFMTGSKTKETKKAAGYSQSFQRWILYCGRGSKAERAWGPFRHPSERTYGVQAWRCLPGCKNPADGGGSGNNERSTGISGIYKSKPGSYSCTVRKRFI